MKIYTKIHNAYVFDFDDVLVKTNASIYVKKEGLTVNKLNSREYAQYILKEDEYFDFIEFRDPSFIESGIPYALFPALRNINNAIEEQRSTSVVYILTAREKIVRYAIYKFISSRGISCLPIQNILTVGDNKHVTSAESKKLELQRILDMGYEITFFDDDIKNIEIANTISGIKTRYVSDDDNI